MSLESNTKGIYSSRVLFVVLTFPDKTVKLINNLDIKVTVKKAMSIEPNTCTAVIYNLSQDSREEIFENNYHAGDWIAKGATRMRVHFEGGVIFDNILINSFSTRDFDTGDWVTTLYAGDSPAIYAAKQDPDKVVPAGKSKKQEIDASLDDFKSIFGKLQLQIEGFTSGNCLENKTLARSVTKGGNILDNIKSILRDCFPEEEYLLFTDDGGNLTLLKADGAISGADFEVGEDLIDPPQLTDQGVNCSVLLNTSAVLGARMVVAADNFELNSGRLSQQQITKKHLAGEGEYLVMEVSHEVDNFSSELAQTHIIARSMEVIFAT